MSAEFHNKAKYSGTDKYVLEGTMIVPVAFKYFKSHFFNAQGAGSTTFGLKNFDGTILTASTGLNHIDIEYFELVGLMETILFYLYHPYDYQILLKILLLNLHPRNLPMLIDFLEDH